MMGDKDENEMSMAVARSVMAEQPRDVLARIFRLGACPFAIQRIQGSVELREEAASWMEVLARPTPAAAQVSTDAVIAYAEECGAGMEFDEIMIAQGCAWAMSDQARGARVSLNVTASTVRSGQLSSIVLRQLDRFGLDAGRVVVELPERAPIHDFARLRRELERLGKHGVQIALDDLGGGHANLRLLSGMTATIAKIDAGFLQDAHSVDVQARVLRELVQMLKRLGVEVVVEGVESQSGLDVVQPMRVWMQGYAIDMPRAVRL